MIRKEIEQISPSHADHISNYRESYLENMFNASKVIAQRKYDGERMLMHFLDGKVYCTSRHVSKKTGKFTECQEKLVNLPLLSSDMGYTVIDCECYADTWSEIASVLHSLPQRAIKLQEKITPRFVVFDVLFFDGEDLRDKSYSTRLAMVDTVLSLISDERFTKPEQWVVSSYRQAMFLAYSQWHLGREGIVVKAMNKSYYDRGAMLKIKRFETVDVVVYDFQPGTGKNSNTVGALLVGYYDPEADSIVHVSRVNCGTDADRAYWKKYFEENSFKPIRRVLEVKCQEVTESSLRHPSYVRIRDDKDYTMCTRDTIFRLKGV